MSKRAAFFDPRFPPLREEELPDIGCDICNESTEKLMISRVLR